MRREGCLLPGMRLTSTTRPDEQVGHVLEAALRLVAIEQAVDLSQYDAACRAMPAHMTADQCQRKIVDGEVGHRLHRADVTDLRGPQIEIVDLDHADVEIDER